jgi:hypothetical protein
VNLDGVVDGEDLALMASRFGALVRPGSSLQANVDPSSPPPASGTVTIQEESSAGDLLRTDVMVGDSVDPAAAADFSVSFDPDVIGFAGFGPGQYLGGPDVLQVPRVEESSRGTITVTIDRIPSRNTVGSGPKLIELFFTAKREGETSLRFEPFQRAGPALLDASGQLVGGVSFGVGAMVQVTSAAGSPGGKVGAPAVLRFDHVTVGSSLRRPLRLSNFGSSDLTVRNVTATTSEFSTYFTGPFELPAYGYVDLPVAFTPESHGARSGEMLIDTTAGAAPLRVALSGAGIGCPLDPLEDADGDLVCGDVDNCPTIRNPNQRDSDGDGAGDFCDDCRVLYNPGQDDGDGDQIGNDCDLCPALYNPGQIDRDADCALDGQDNCLAAFNPTQADQDGDGVGDACDGCPSVYDPAQTDTDTDRIPDACDACPYDGRNDVDGDGACGGPDNCDEIYNPAQLDSDGDLYGDACDDCPSLYNPVQYGPDQDGDGILDACDNCLTTYNPFQDDRDSDGSGDACQPDLAIVSITQDGGAELVVTVHLSDPQGDALSGIVEVRGEPFLLMDALSSPDCSAPRPPEGLTGLGIGFGPLSGTLPSRRESGGPGSPQSALPTSYGLSDYDAAAGCQDGVADYEMALGNCGTEESGYGTSLPLTGVVAPQRICVRRVDLTGAFRYEIHDVSALQVGLFRIENEASYQGTVLPQGMSLGGLAIGQGYVLVLTASDGTTPVVVATAPFLYQGEQAIRFIIQ